MCSLDSFGNVVLKDESFGGLNTEVLVEGVSETVSFLIKIVSLNNLGMFVLKDETFGGFKY